MTRSKIEPDSVPTGPSAVIANIAALKARLTDSLAAGRGVHVDTSALQQADVTFVQLMASAAATFAKRDLAFALTELPAPVRQVFARAAVPVPFVASNTI